ncbi:MAG: hypothetical protein M0D57_20445 [Sphingobacteriales bacterium JAD_PAG50586_3]|nr:MAG: hypothetical protein M0D57_20445 [Sphingobacteriales bacterium JAD_PAG50586_3]
MKRLLLILVCIVAIGTAKGQNVLLEQDPAADTTTETIGPNLRDFFQTFYGYGNFIGTNNPATAVRYTSYHLTAGIRYKRRISEYYSIGTELAYTNNTYALKQQPSKQVPDSVLHKKERLSWMYMGLSNI